MGYATEISYDTPAWDKAVAVQQRMQMVRTLDGAPMLNVGSCAEAAVLHSGSDCRAIPTGGRLGTLDIVSAFLSLPQNQCLNPTTRPRPWRQPFVAWG
jgi:hypothetical protein